MPSAAARQYVFRLKGRHFIHLFHKINKIFPLNKIFTDIFFLLQFLRGETPPKKKPYYIQDNFTHMLNCI